jgi:hypothetical protein
MDQAAFQDQSLLWHEGKRCQDPNLDRHRCLCIGGHRQKAIEFRPESLYNSTDFERESFRKNTLLRALSSIDDIEPKGIICNQLSLFN